MAFVIQSIGPPVKCGITTKAHVTFNFQFVIFSIGIFHSLNPISRNASLNVISSPTPVYAVFLFIDSRRQWLLISRLGEYLILIAGLYYPIFLNSFKPLTVSIVPYPNSVTTSLCGFLSFTNQPTYAFRAIGQLI